ncbi:MAG: S41 family peptidase [Saprospiraceae bacterium]
MKIYFTLLMSVFFLSTSLNAQYRDFELVEQATRIIQNNYYDTAYGNVENWDTLKNHILKSTLNGEKGNDAIQTILSTIGDPALRLLNQDEFKVFFEEILTNQYTGIGLTELLGMDIDQTTGKLIVVAPIYGSAAFAAGVLPNDEIIEINKKSVKGLSLEESAQLLRVKKGKKVDLLVNRNGTEKAFSIVATEMKTLIYPLYQLVKYKRKKIGVIWIPQFMEGTGFRLLEILNELKEKGAEGFVIDLRNNYGGLIQEAQNSAGIFAGQKPMAFTQSKNSAIKMIATTGIQQCDLPVTILVNEGTASAAEAFAGVLQYYKRAKIIGMPTNGKGLMYSFYDLANRSTLIVPIGRLRMLNKDDILTKGITPDELFESKKTFKLYKSYKKDPMLKHSVRQLVRSLK